MNDHKEEHGLYASTLYSATCICGQIERSTIRYAAEELYLRDHIKAATESAEGA